MDKKMSRREMLKLGSVAGASVVGGGLAGLAFSPPPVQAQNGVWPWPLTKKINANKAAKAAYENYYVKGCMYGSFTGIVAKVAEDLGPPYSDFPMDMMHYGAGGGELWGSLCGTLNGGLAALAVFVGDTALRRQMANQLMAWYEKTNLPTWKPAKVIPDGVKKNLPKSKSFSPLCHVSVQRWVVKSGFEPFSPQRSDRCGRISASVAKFVAIQLNEALVKGNLKNRKEISKAAQLCTGCHGKGTGMNEPEILGRMDCTLCHDFETDKTVIPHL
jgi:hypothetical protein